MHSTVAELGTPQTEVQEFSGAARLAGCARLLRPANLVTSGADVLTGFVIVGAPAGGLLWPLIASVSLYAGGIILNDYFDRKLDTIERPERPIPSGLIPAASAATLGFTLLLVGVAAAFRASPVTGLIAVVLVLAILAYDCGMKHHAAGSLVMGSCRGLNLLLGLAAVPALLPHLWFLALLPFAYITGVTLLSRGEVLGGTHNTSAVALALFAGVLVTAGALRLNQPSALIAMSPFLVLLAFKAGIPLWRAYLDPEAARIRGAVHAGVVSLIVLDAALAAGHAGLVCGAAILSLSVLAGELGKLFPVT